MLKTLPAIVIAFVSGLVIGLTSSWWWGKLQSKPSTTPIVISAPGDITEGTTRVSGVSTSIWINIERDGNLSRVPAIVIDGHSVAIAALYSVYPAQTAYFIDTHGASIPLKIIAADESSGLIGFEIPFTDHRGIQLSDDDASLYLGKEVYLELPNQRFEGQINSALTEDTQNRMSYEILFESVIPTQSGAILDRQNKTLIGFIPTPALHTNTSGQTYAIDATSIRQFLASRLSAPLNTLQFSEQWSRTAGGLNLTLRKLASQNQWVDALAVAKEIWNLNQDSHGTHAATLSQTALFAAHQLHEQGDMHRAMIIISEMKQMFGQVQPWCTVESQIFMAQSHWRQALLAIDQCLTRDTSADHAWKSYSQSAQTYAQIILKAGSDRSLKTLSTSVALSAANDQSLTLAQLQSLLQSAADIQPEAPLFRLLGDMEFDFGRYASAQSYYQRAIALDPSLSFVLSNRIQNAEQRSETIPSTEVPFENRRGALVISAFLNQSPQAFRFLVDTGATYSAVSTATLLRLGLQDVFANGAPLIELESAAGPIFVQRFTLDSMRIGSAKIDHIPVVILEDLDGFDGLVGLSFLRHFDVTLDQEAGKLILTRL